MRTTFTNSERRAKMRTNYRLYFIRWERERENNDRYTYNLGTIQVHFHTQLQAFCFGRGSVKRSDQKKTRRRVWTHFIDYCYLLKREVARVQRKIQQEKGGNAQTSEWTLSPFAEICVNEEEWFKMGVRFWDAFDSLTTAAFWGDDDGICKMHHFYSQLLLFNAHLSYTLKRSISLRFFLQKEILRIRSKGRNTACR